VLLVLALVGLGVNRYCINKTYTVKVSSDHPIGFYGHYTWHTAFGNSPLKQLSDTSPTQYTVNGIDVSVYFVVPEYPSSQTMRGNFGDIEVEIIRGGVILAKSKTTTTNRIISINAH